MGTEDRPEPRYALYPQRILSSYDRQWHFVSAIDLCHLYRVRLEDCLVVRTEDFGRPDKRGLIERAGKLIPLKPRYDGNYNLPDMQQK